MAGKDSTLVLKVNLDCSCCHKKISNVIYKLQLEKENIKTITYDKKTQTVSIAGPFDNPERLKSKLESMAGRVIKNVQIKIDPQKPKNKATQARVHFPEDLINAEKQKQPKRRLQQKERGDALRQPVQTDDHGPPEAQATQRPAKVVSSSVPYYPAQPHRILQFSREEDEHTGCSVM